MDLKNVLQELEIEDSFYEFIAPGWDNSLACQPEIIDFLDTEKIRKNMVWCSLPGEYFDELAAVAAMIKNSPALTAFAWHCYHQLYHDRQVLSFRTWPNRAPLPMLYLLVSLGMMPLVREKHREMGVDETVTRDSSREVSGFCQNHVQAFKAPGIIQKQLHWFRQYVDGRLFRLGRFEYKFEPVRAFGKAFRNRDTSEVVAFCSSGERHNSTGLVTVEGDVFDEENVWISKFEETADYVRGNPISPYGFAVNKQLELSLDKWECVIKEGDEFLDMHIPPGGGMTPEACIDSMRRAVEFFGKHFPERKTNAIMCRSWIFNTSFEKQLPDSNLAKFMRELYLFPIASNGNDGFFFVFGREYDDLSQAPRDTSLQCAMLDILAKEPLKSTGMFILHGDLPYFGSQHYRKQADAKA